MSKLPPGMNAHFHEEGQRTYSKDQAIREEFKKRFVQLNGEFAPLVLEIFNYAELSSIKQTLNEMQRALDDSKDYLREKKHD